VLSAIDDDLAKRGHRVWVIACAGSQSRGTLICCGRSLELVDSSRRLRTQVRVKRLIERLVKRQSIDLVHFHGLDFCEYLPNDGPPLLATLHLPVCLYPNQVFDRHQRQLHLHCVSRTQHRTCPAPERLLPPIPNGVRLSQFTPRTDKQDYLLTMGRICPEKGYHLALEAAHAAGLPLILAGRVFPYPEHVKYFQERVVPLLDGRRRFIGPLDRAERARLLARARCLVIPSLIEETSSLVAMEAFASATPVVALRRGALPEVVEDGKTGILVNDLREMISALGRIRAIDPRTCRREAEKRFSSEKMLECYSLAYQRLIGGLANVD